jgi:peptidoglycan hydrolase-like protein with peptidoglycan-binding domain
MLKKFLLIFFILIIFSNQTDRVYAAYRTGVDSHLLTQKSKIKLIQRALKSQGFYVGKINGQAGYKTSNAIRKFQVQQGYPVTGFATATLLNQLQLGSVQQSSTSISSQHHPVYNHYQSQYQPQQATTYDKNIVGTSTAVSAGLGALIGAVIGASLGNRTNALKGAALGAMAGAVTDVAVNSYRVNQAQTEHQFNRSINQVREQNQELTMKINDANSMIREDKKKVQQINRQLKQKNLTQQQAQQKFRQLDQNRALLQTTYNDLLKKEKKLQKIAYTPSASDAVNNDYNRLREEITSLKIQLDELDQLRSISISG